MSLNNWSKTFGVAIAAGALLLVGACGSSDTKEKDAKPSSGSSDTSKSNGSGSSSGGAAATPMTTSDFGTRLMAAQKKAGSYTFTMTTSAAGQKSTGSGMARTDSSTPEASTKMEVGGQTIESVVTGGFYYMKAPMLKTEKPWLKIDPNAKTGLGALIGQMGGSGDPAKNLAALTAASEVTKLGTEDVKGTSTTRYKVVVPRDAMVKAMGFPDQMAAMLPAEIGYEIWADSKDLPRRMVSKMTIQGQEATTEVEFDDFGKKVDIKAPPADQVTTNFNPAG